MKKTKHSWFLLVILIGLATGLFVALIKLESIVNEARINAKSSESLAASAGRVRQSLPPQDREKFDEAFDYFTFDQIKSIKLANSSEQELERLRTEARMTIHRKTGAQVLKKWDSVLKTRKWKTTNPDKDIRKTKDSGVKIIELELDKAVLPMISLKGAVDNVTGENLLRVRAIAIFKDSNGNTLEKTESSITSLGEGERMTFEVFARTPGADYAEVHFASGSRRLTIEGDWHPWRVGW